MENSNKRHIEMFQEYMVPTYSPTLVIQKGAGSRVWDLNQKEYIDLAGGIAVLGLGHCHPDLVEVLQNQLNQVWHLSNMFSNVPVLEFVKKLTQATFGDQVFMSNSGGEANEAALKLARRYAFDHFGSEKNEIISFHNSFHGRTLFTVAVGGQEKYRAGFGPMPGNIKYANYNEIGNFKNLISDHTCAVIIEPIQGEGGVINADAEFMQGVNNLCKEHHALLIFDEIQTGVGRTGKLFAYQGLDMIPDILTFAKSIGNGFPVGGMLTTKRIASSFVVGTHGSTYGGNPLGACVASKVLELINTPEVLTGVEERRNKIESFYKRINAELNIFGPIRGKGLLIGLPLLEKWKGKARNFLNAGLDQGVLSLVAGPDVLRMAPSLIISEEELEEGLNRFKKAIRFVVQTS